jgi:hypothetical protein
MSSESPVGDGYGEARARFDEAVAGGDWVAAEVALGDMRAAVAGLEDAAVAAAVRDAELYVMAQACDWWWEPR